MTDTATHQTYETLHTDLPHESRTIAVTNQQDGRFLLMTEIQTNVFVGWDTCHACKKGVKLCACTAGPTEAPAVAGWREERYGAFTPRVTTTATMSPELELALGELERVAAGDSNDEHIAALQDALDLALEAAGFREAEPVIEPVVEPEPAVVETPQVIAEPVVDKRDINSGVSAARAAVLARAAALKEDSDDDDF